MTTILEDLHSAHGHIRITKDKDGTVTFLQNGIFQSQADKHGNSTAAYIHVMADLMSQVNPQRVLIIGGAGGTLATLMQRRGCHVTMLDVNGYAFTLARRYFNLPESVQCVESEGYKYLMKSNEQYDAIALDAFDEKGFIPSVLTRTTFFRLVREALRPQGIAVMNILAAHDLDMGPDRIAQRASDAKLPIIMFDWLGHQTRNCLLAMGDIAALDVPHYAEPEWLVKEAAGLERRLARA